MVTKRFRLGHKFKKVFWCGHKVTRYFKPSQIVTMVAAASDGGDHPLIELR